MPRRVERRGQSLIRSSQWNRCESGESIDTTPSGDKPRRHRRWGGAPAQSKKMTLDVVNHENEKVGALDVRDDVFGGRVNTDLIWASVVHANAAKRRGTHATKNRALVSGSGRKPWRQKGTGRARVGEIRNPLWRHGGTVFGPTPR